MATKHDLAKLVQAAEKIHRRKVAQETQEASGTLDTKEDEGRHALEALSEIYGKKIAREAVRVVERDEKREKTAVENCLTGYQRKIELESEVQQRNAENYISGNGTFFSAMIGGVAGVYLGLATTAAMAQGNGVSPWAATFFGFIVTGLGGVAGGYLSSLPGQALGRLSFNRRKKKELPLLEEALKKAVQQSENYKTHPAPNDLILYHQEKGDDIYERNHSLRFAQVVSLSPQGITAMNRYQKKDEKRTEILQQELYLTEKDLVCVVMPRTDEPLSSQQLLHLAQKTPLVCIQDGKVVSYGFLGGIAQDKMTLSIDADCTLEQEMQQLQDVESGKVQVYELLVKREEKKNVKKSM